jgi:hypothetical protein
VRRTSSVDIVAVAADPVSLDLSGRARDLHTARDGSTTVVGRAFVRAATVAGVVERLSTHPAPEAAAALVGRRLAVGFRTAIWRNLRADYDEGTPLHALLDELPGCNVISGWAVRRSAAARGVVRTGERRLDVCAGWASDSHAADVHRATGQSPPPRETPVARSVVAPDDPTGWHAVARLPVGAMSRRRRLDVTAVGDTLEVDAAFRDVFADDDGVERVLHEYAVRGVVDVATENVLDLVALPVVLPHGECPSSAASVTRLLPTRIGNLREQVSMDLFGPTSCTHLNDMLRSLADVPRLAAHLMASAR